MALSKHTINGLNKIIETAKKIIETAEHEVDSGKKRARRSSADAEKMKAAIKTARAKGVPVVKLAKKYGDSTAYVYMIK